MIPAPLSTIKQSLNKAYRLLKPKRARIEAFKANLSAKSLHELILDYLHGRLVGNNTDVR